MSIAQRFAQVFGIIYLLVGILGFIPLLLTDTDLGRVLWGPSGGFLIGLFAVNWLHNLAHLLIGAAGLATFRNPVGARSYALVIGVAYTALFLLGLVAREIGTLGGLLPLNVWDDILHLLTALLAFGAYFASRRAPETSPRV